MSARNDKQADDELIPTRRQIVRSVFVFQYKLFIDAAKDLLLSPLSLAAGLVDLIRPAPPSRMLFPALMRQGRRAERAINLFGRKRATSEWTVDQLMEQMEEHLRTRYLGGDDGVPGEAPPDGNKDLEEGK